MKGKSFTLNLFIEVFKFNQLTNGEIEMEQMIILDTMLQRAKNNTSDLQMEVLVSLINNITDDSFSLSDLSSACENALCEWDI